MIFIFPTELEAARFRTAAPNANIVICGVGMAECGVVTSQLITKYGNHESYIMAGIAGSYDLDRIALCECVEVTEETIEELPERFRAGYKNVSPMTTLRPTKSNCVSSYQSSQSCDIENMEGAPFFAHCLSQGVQFTEIRAISNRVGDPFPLWRIGEALDSLTAELLKIYNR